MDLPLNSSIDTDPQQQKAASPQVWVVRSFLSMRRSCVPALLFVAAQCAAGPQAPFSGTWQFLESTGWQWAAELKLEQSGNVVRGTWSYECSRNGCRGWAGELKGNVKGSRIIARRCYEDGSGWGSESPICPDFHAADTVITRVGKSLKWCFGSGLAKRCFVLNRSEN